MDEITLLARIDALRPHLAGMGVADAISVLMTLVGEIIDFAEIPDLWQTLETGCANERIKRQH